MKIGIVGLAALCALSALLSGCGGGGETAATASKELSAQVAATALSTNSLTVVEDTYGLQHSTYLIASVCDSFMSIRSAIAASQVDPNFRTVLRIDVKDPRNFAGPGSYSLGSEGSHPAFPGEVLVFNGRLSTRLRTIGGTIVFDSYGSEPGDVVSGAFQIRVEDGNLPAPHPVYTIHSRFRMTVGSAAPVAASLVPPASNAALALYDANCASCHELGEYDTASKEAPDLSLKGGIVEERLGEGGGHGGVALAAAEMRELKRLLNAM